MAEYLTIYYERLYVVPLHGVLLSDSILKEIKPFWDYYILILGAKLKYI